METITQRSAPKILLAFAIIYFVWGSTYFAIRVGVREVPPFLLAGMRFIAAGLILYGWAAAKGETKASARQLASAAVLSFFFFVLDYGLLFWAEQRVASGVAAVVLATIPAFIAVFEIIFLRSQRFTLKLIFALAIGICGVAVLTSSGLNLGGAAIDRTGAIALLIGSLSWSVASVFTRIVPLPASKAMSSASQMLVGGVLLVLASAALGEFRDFHPANVSRGAWVALAYLIVAGSILGFTAYLWLIHQVSPTKVGTYAYVNPIVAILIGYFWGGEAIGARTIVGASLVVVSVVVITMMKATKLNAPLPINAATKSVES